MTRRFGPPAAGLPASKTGSRFEPHVQLPNEMTGSRFELTYCPEGALAHPNLVISCVWISQNKHELSCGLARKERRRIVDRGNVTLGSPQGSGTVLGLSRVQSAQIVSDVAIVRPAERQPLLRRRRSARFWGSKYRGAGSEVPCLAVHPRQDGMSATNEWGPEMYYSSMSALWAHSRAASWSVVSATPYRSARNRRCASRLNGP